MIIIITPALLTRDKNVITQLVAVRYASHTDCLEFPVPFRRGHAARDPSVFKRLRRIVVVCFAVAVMEMDL